VARIRSVSDRQASEPFWLRADLHVAGVAVIVLVLSWALRAETSQWPSKRVAHGKLSAAVPASWLAEPPSGETTAVRGEDAVTRLELRVTEPPTGQVSLDSALELERGHRYGELYQRASSERRVLGGVPVLRTAYSYAFKPTPTHAPRIAAAVEIAFPVDAQGKPLYVVTLHAPDDRLSELEGRIMPSIEVAP
jgi:hypothetical protein